MKNNITSLIYILLFISSPVFADLISVSNNLPLIYNLDRREIDSSTQPAQIINLPTSVVNYYHDIETMVGFNENQNVLLLEPLEIDGDTFIDSGTVVSSHIIFLTVAKEDRNLLFHRNVQWEFDSPIQGVMSNNTGSLIFQSSPILGAEETVYHPQDTIIYNYGMENNENYSINENLLTISLMNGWLGPGDWIRVITLGDNSSIPEPTALLLLLFCLPLISLTKKRSR